MENNNAAQKSDTVFSLGISTETASKLKYGFIAERDSVQEAIEAEARLLKVDPLQVYATRLALGVFDERFDRYEAKRTAVLEKAVKVLVAGGMTAEKARQALGLGN
jgi:hypothetical protein